jgi:16S rRNA (cytosine1402-N4)-methyltransferase
MDQAHYHEPVMVTEVAGLLAPVPAGTIVDATFGGGGHTRALLAACPQCSILAIDRDPEAARRVPEDQRLRFVAGNFGNLEEIVAAAACTEISGAVFDLGVSSRQLDAAERGFSYRRSGPLDMRMGPDATLTAADIVNEWPAAEIVRILFEYGEEPAARRIADAIVRSRPLSSTTELADVVAAAVPAAGRRRRHPARRTFQALRIAVNDELAAIGPGIDAAIRLLRPGGRIVVISYHSLEDRIAKRRFAAAAGRGPDPFPPDLPVRNRGRAAPLRLLARKPLRPGEDEIDRNPRARSARLRAVEKAAA